MKTVLIWEKLQLNNQKIVTSDEIKEYARQLGRDELDVIRYLQRHAYIDRIFRGYFYVKSYDEHRRKSFDFPILDIIAMGLKAKGVKNWYFGLGTALKLNNMTHEYFTTDFVITDSYRTTKIIEIFGQRFQFIKWHGGHFNEDWIIKRKLTRYSNPQKTVLDLAYRRYIKARDENYIPGPIKEYENMLASHDLEKYLRIYPPLFCQIVEDYL
mgnify:CR=1 FL=1